MRRKLENLQLVLFTTEFAIPNKAKLSVEISEKLPIFDGDPIILPLPDDIPPELPRIQLTSRDNHHSMAISKNRFDLSRKYVPEDRQELPDHATIESFLIVAEHFFTNLHTSIIRAAIVTSHAIDLVDESGAHFIHGKYLDENSLFQNSYDLEIHSLKKEKIGGFDANQWFRIKSARKQSDLSQDNFLICHSDINTLPEIVYDFDIESLKRFLAEASKQIRDTITSHFPSKVPS